MTKSQLRVRCAPSSCLTDPPEVTHGSALLPHLPCDDKHVGLSPASSRLIKSAHNAAVCVCRSDQRIWRIRLSGRGGGNRKGLGVSDLSDLKLTKELTTLRVRTNIHNEVLGRIKRSLDYPLLSEKNYHDFLFERNILLSTKL